MRLLSTELNFLALDEQNSYQESPFRPSNLKINGKPYHKPVDHAELLKAYQKFEELVGFKIDGWEYDPSDRGDSQEVAFRKRFRERIVSLGSQEFRGTAQFLLTTLEDLTEVEISFSSIPNKLARYAEYLVAIADAINVIDKLLDKIKTEQEIQDEEYELDLVINSKTYLSAWIKAQADVTYQVKGKKDTETVGLTQSKMSVTQEAFAKGWAILNPDKARERIARKREHLNEVRYFNYCLDTLKVWYSGIEKAAASNAVLMKTYGKLS